jgi:hypothetical protein
MVTASGQAVRFPVQVLRSASRTSGGVRGIRPAKNDKVVGLEVARVDKQLLVITRSGFGKRTPVEEYPTHGRGGQGVRSFHVTPKTGPLVATHIVDPSQELVIISEAGIVLRTPIDSIAIQGRATQGVTIMGVGPGDAVASISTIELVDEAAEEPAKKKKAGARTAKKTAGKAKGKAGPQAKAPAKERTPAKAKTAAKPTAGAKDKATTKAKTPQAKAPAKGRATTKAKTATKPAARAKPGAATKKRGKAGGSTGQGRGKA